MKDINRYFGIFDQLITSGGNFFLAIILSKLLLLDDFGMYSVIWIGIISFGTLFSSWFASPLLSIGPTLSESEFNQFVSDLTKQILAALGCLTLILIAVFILLDDIFEIEVFILCSSLVPYLLYDFLRRLAMVKERLRSLLVISLCLYGLLFSACLLYFDGNFLSVTKIISMSYGVCAILLLVTLRTNFIIGKLDRLNSRRVEFAKWMSYSSLVQFMSGNAVSIASAALLPLAEIGLLRLAQTFVSLFNPVLIYLDNYARIYLSRVLDSSGKDGLDLAFKSFKLKFLFISCFAGLILGVTGVISIDLFYPELSDSNIREYFALYLLLILLTATTFIIRLRLLVLEETNYIFRTYCVGMVVSFVLFFPMVSFYEGFGVIGTLFTAHTCVLITLVWPRFVGR